MGNYNNKNFIIMSDANVIVETATADCPSVNLTLTGANKDDTETFETAGYTDGYLAEVELTWGATYWTAMTDGTSVQAASFIARTNEDDAVTATPNGAWFALQEWTVTTAAAYTAATYFIPALEVAIASDSTGAVTLSTDADLQYGAVADVDVASDDQATGDSVSYSFLMPISSSDSETGATVAAEGDRFDKGTTLAYYSSVGANSVVNAATACQAESDEVSLGASALVAGSVAFAAALAF